MHEHWSGSPEAHAAAAAIEPCVHCGFCLATCPTYLDTRDERDSPRGRIYLVKNLLESGQADASSVRHIDRCLSCRSCETTCPSGVAYGDIVDRARVLMDDSQERSWRERMLRGALLFAVPERRRFGVLLRVARAVARLLPAALAGKVPQADPVLQLPQPKQHSRRVVLLEGCVQAAATPNTNAAVRNILDSLGIGVHETPRQGCCGALRGHLGQRASSLDDMRRNIDAWWPAIQAGAEAVISTATGCGAMLADYAHALATDPRYAERAREVARRSKDLASFLDAEIQHLRPADRGASAPRIAVHVPCSQMHALREGNSVRDLLQQRGFTLTTTREDHLCCGSAGSYSILQPAMSERLRERKLRALEDDAPELIVTANVGCQLHLAAAAGVPVRHWAEVLWESIACNDGAISRKSTAL